MTYSLWFPWLSQTEESLNTASLPSGNSTPSYNQGKWVPSTQGHYPPVPLLASWHLPKGCCPFVHWGHLTESGKRLPLWAPLCLSHFSCSHFSCSYNPPRSPPVIFLGRHLKRSPQSLGQTRLLFPYILFRTDLFSIGTVPPQLRRSHYFLAIAFLSFWLGEVERLWMGASY